MKKYLYIFIVICISSGIAWAQSGWLGIFWFVFVLPFLVFVTFPAIIAAIILAKHFTVGQIISVKRVLTVLLTALFLHHLVVPVLTDSELDNGVVIFPSSFTATPPTGLTILSNVFILVGIPTILVSTVVLIVKLIGYRRVSSSDATMPPAQK